MQSGQFINIRFWANRNQQGHSFGWLRIGQRKERPSVGYKYSICAQFSTMLDKYQQKSNTLYSIKSILYFITIQHDRGKHCSDLLIFPVPPIYLRVDPPRAAVLMAASNEAISSFIVTLSYNYCGSSYICLVQHL